MKTRREFFGCVVVPIVAGRAVMAVLPVRHPIEGWAWPKEALDIMPKVGNMPQVMMADHRRSLLQVLSTEPPKGSEFAITTAMLGEWVTMIIWRRDQRNGYRPIMGHATSSTDHGLFDFA